jgi:hypothetical protein
MSKTATYSLIASTTLTSTSTTVTFSDIPQTFTDLYFVCESYNESDGVNVTFQVGNGSIDTGLNYSSTSLQGNGTAAGSYRESGQARFLCSFPNASGSTTVPLSLKFHLMDYSNTTTYKTNLLRVGTAGTTYPGLALIAELWRSTAAINTIRMSVSANRYAVGSTFKLYGILAGNA